MLENDVDIRSFGIHDSYRISSLLLSYSMMYTDSDENGGPKKLMVPTWVFDISSGENTGTIMVNAIDGSYLRGY